MFDAGLGISEMVVIAVVALLVVGPKDLPIMMRKVGGWVKKMRAMASDFQHSFDELARQSELDELRKEIDELRDLNPINKMKNDMGKAFDLNSDYYASKPITYDDTQTEEAIIAQKLAAARAKEKSEVIIETAKPTDEPILKPKKPRKPRNKAIINANVDETANYE